MEDQESLGIKEVNESNILKYKRRNADGRTLKHRNQKQLPIVKIVIVVVLSLLALVFVFKFVDMQRRLKAIEEKGSGNKVTEVKGEQRTAGSDLQALKGRIEELQVKLHSATQQLLSLQGQPSKQSGSSVKPADLSSLNSTTLLEYMEHRFANFQTAINFLHMHDSETYFYKKVDFLKQFLNTDLLRTYEKAKVSFMQALNNYKLPHSNVHIQNQVNEWLKKEHDRLSREYDFNLQELPFCIVVPTLNNAKNFRYEYNLQSMINLDYKNFKIVIVDDASTDQTYELIKLWIEQNKITHDIVVLTNQKRMTAVPNIHRAVTQHCSVDSIVVLVDGDDELLGRYSLKVFNHIYQKQKADVVYSTHIQLYTHTKQTMRGWSMNYADEQKRSNRYRDVPQKISHLRSFKTKLYLKVKEEDLKDNEGKWLTSTYDEVICLPILEMSCGRIVYVQEFFYLYNFGIGTNDLQVDPGLQKSVADYVKYKKPKYQCLND